jgi:2-polyprenyl-3-methyl-5-hydroxy-6-metoxy-1,4-benzoquinol methylase
VQDDLLSQDPVAFAESEWISVDSCPLCGSGAGLQEPFASQTTERGKVRYVLCRRCGLVFQSPRLTEVALQGYYRHLYSRRGHSREQNPEKDRWVQRNRAEHLAGLVRGLRPQLRRHLDVGSSSGELLMTFQREFGGEGYGVEPGESELEQASAAGLQVVASIEQLPRHAAGTFDLVTLSHVLEHLPDPVGTLQLIRREWLAADGLVLVETPNLYGHPSFELGHLAVFTPQTLRSALTSAGLKPVELRRHGKPYSRLLPLFLLAIARPIPSGAQARLNSARPAWIRLRRRMGLLLTDAAWAAGRLLLGTRRLKPWSE